MLLDGENWSRRFAEIKREAWRLETLPQYLVPQEDKEFSAFREGRPPTPYTDSAYTERVRRQKAEGKRNGRVHIVTQPLSDYLRFEFSRYYTAHALAGDNIRILDVTSRLNPLEGVQDFWMFDQAEVVLMNYEANGTQINREVFEGDVSRFIEYQRTAIAESVPFEEYVNGGHPA
ncbi:MULTISPECIES: DUF6879 family protein [Streptomyces]|uniref:DUF6879 domain-containing protein n=1 Tax=Streptomyces tsukubensis (strain DSM 42081 / NBRC 108919 / NRRL 18488 / 9993) TaxID=1114943 RepID=A0A7G3UGV4_STRT9|nr:DUF6879 family protein [Streptomyces tsukubensis]AZK94237.1 hypothetical protein B7R87_10440 [Streptomyces tsukubensis]MYS68013.1 hypothetical protein [Streptomyces sp. SID5473]QKM69663.1 hypothetical protein STSU_023355 [Streptomyces tsukubensis NRRL18488]TAI46372.1 hypothetical protein EWI31_04800 [Streptomyces tsukubensis]